MSTPDEDAMCAIRAHATLLSKQFPVDRDDLIQEQLLWWVSHPRSVQRYLEHADEEAGQRLLSRALRNAALAYAHREKARQVGYDISDLFFYSVGLLRELVPAVYDDDAWLRVGRSQVNDMPRGKSVPSEGNNVIAGLVDVRRGMERVPASVHDLLWRWVDMGTDEERLGRYLGVTTDAARMRVNRALRRLQSELGGERPDWAAAAHGGVPEQQHGGDAPRVERPLPDATGLDESAD